LRDNPDGAQTTEVVPNVFGGKAVLLALIVRHPEASFFYRHRTQARCFAQCCLRHGLTNSIDLGLIESSNLQLGLVRVFDKVPCLLHRDEILICGHNKPPTLLVVVVVVNRASTK
jgi:hypothetical protein